MKQDFTAFMFAQSGHWERFDKQAKESLTGEQIKDQVWQGIVYANQRFNKYGVPTGERYYQPQALPAGWKEEHPQAEVALHILVNVSGFPTTQREFENGLKKAYRYVDKLLYNEGGAGLQFQKALNAWWIFSNEFGKPKAFPFDSVYFLPLGKTDYAHTRARAPYDIFINSKQEHYGEWLSGNVEVSLVHEFIHRERLHTGRLMEEHVFVEEGLTQVLSLKAFERNSSLVHDAGYDNYNALAKNAVEFLIFQKNEPLQSIIGLSKEAINHRLAPKNVDMLEYSLRKTDQTLKLFERLYALGVIREDAITRIFDRINREWETEWGISAKFEVRSDEEQQLSDTSFEDETFPTEYE